MHIQKKTLTERLVHALTFELTAIAICAPLVSWVLGLSLVHVGALTAVVSLVAMVWNIVFNAGFDRLERHFRLTRNLMLRIVHTIAFEFGLVVMVVPLAAWWLGIGMLEALLLDLGILLFFLPYTFFFNLGYDRLRAWSHINARQAAATRRTPRRRCHKPQRPAA